MHRIRTFRALASAAFLVVLSSLPVWAEEAEAAAAAEGGHGGGGLPQFDPSWFAEQIFWVFVSFACLYVLMAFIAVPRIEHTQANRKKVISTEIETAKTANAAAKTSLEASEKALNEARAKAQAEMNEMLATVTEEATGRQLAQEKELLRKLRSAEEDIATSRTAALDQVRVVANDLAKEIVEKILDTQRRARA